MKGVVLIDPGHQVPYYDQFLAGALAAAGHDVTLATAPLPYYDLPPPPDVTEVRAFGRWLPVAGRGGRPVKAHPWLRRALRLGPYPAELSGLARRLVAHPPAVAHVQWSLVPPLEARAWRRVRAAGVPLVYTAHNVLPHEPRRWHAAAYRALYRSVDRVIVHSRAARARLLALSGLDAARVAVVPMAADVPSGPPPEQAAARAALGLAQDGPLALFFGHVRPYKGLDRLVAAWPAVQAEVPDARLLVAGPVAGGVGAVRRLRAELAPRALARGVTIWPGHVPAGRVDALFAAADVVALPYRDTDDSAVLQAARGRGKAVVASAVGGLPEALAAGGGLLVPPDDTAAWVDALVAVLRDPLHRATLEAAARAAAAARTWADVARETVAVYRAAGARL